MLDKIKLHFQKKHNVKICREIEDYSTSNSGYIVDYSPDFIILQETEDFKLNGYLVLPISQITEIRFNNNDKYYTKIMIWEKESDNIGIPYKIDLSSWPSIFKSIKSRNLNVIVECEASSINTFNIGPIVRITKNRINILYFDAKGMFEKEPTSIEYKNISIVTFDDRYINVFSKYLRERS